MAQLDVVHAEVETLLTGHVAAPLCNLTIGCESRSDDREMKELTRASGGIPCRMITEIVGPRWCSTGRKTLQAQLLASGTEEQFCVMVDAQLLDRIAQHITAWSFVSICAVITVISATIVLIEGGQEAHNDRQRATQLAN